MESAFTKKTIRCHFCDKMFSSQSSRANHHKFQHMKEHRLLKGHRKLPDYLCKHCHNGFGSRQSKWNHEQRCLSNPEVGKQLKMMKKQNEKFITEDLKKFITKKNKNRQ